MVNNEQNKQGAAAFHADEDQIGRLLSTLPRVDAPGDFDFRVKARIAAGRPAANRASWLPASVRMAVPLALVLVGGGYLALNSFYSPGDINVAEVAVNAQSFAPAQLPNDSVTSPTDVVVAGSSETRSAQPVNGEFVKNAQGPGPAPVPRATRPGGGSFDSAQVVNRPIINLAPNRVDGNNVNGSPAPAPSSAGEILAAAGIIAVNVDGNWQVQSVAAGKSAQRAGIRTGDVIMSIIQSGTLVIRRDGKRMRFDLKD